MRCFALAIAAALAVIACSGPDADKPRTPAAAPVAAARDDEAAAGQALAERAPAADTAGEPQAPIVAATPPAGALYICALDAAGQKQATPIEFAPEVAGLCRKAPEMGACRYERDACRRKGGRVFTADGAEITLATEVEYDKHVLRIQMKSN